MSVTGQFGSTVCCAWISHGTVSTNSQSAGSEYS